MANNEKQEKEIKQVVNSPAKTRKKSEARKFADSFIAEDAGNVGSYILKEVLIPSAKKLIADITKNAIDMFLYGDTDRPKKRSGSRISYRDYYDDRDRDRRDDRRSSSRSRSSLEYDEIVLDTRGEAELVLDELDRIIARYQFASVADLYEIAGIDNDNYTLHRYGWTSIRSATIKRIRDGYLLVMPKAMPID